MTIISIAILLISAAVLALELVLVRALSIGHWHHFSYLIISTALLGFGAGGVLVAIFSKSFAKHYIKYLWSFTIGLALSVPIVFWLCQRVPLDELQLIWDHRQWFYLFIYYLLFFVPFFCAGLCVALAFTVCTSNAHRLYFYNMTGSGLGVVGIVLMMYNLPPEQLLLVISSIAFSAALVLAFGLSGRWIAATLVCAAACLLAFSQLPRLALKINISENKSLVFYRALPQAETVAVRYSPLGRLDCLKAPAIRHFPGLSIAYQGKLPQQLLIITDADGISAVNNFENLSELSCYNHMTSALAYHLTSRPNVCIIGAGGGSDVVQALAAGAQDVTAVEMNPQVIDLVRNSFDKFASGLYRRDDVEVVIAEGRNFLQTTQQLFDIISISLLDSFSASAAGVYALHESHLYTSQAIEQALARLQPAGLLSVTRMLKTPPRDNLKMLATITEALRNRGIDNPSDHIIMIRSWATATIAASGQPFTPLQVAAARSFAAQRSFDLVHLPGLQPEDTNRFHVLESPVYYQGARQILSANYESFYRDYTYNIAPATDDRPYFFDFFKWKTLPQMISAIPGQWLPFSEWGYLVMTATLLQAFCVGGLLIVLPLAIAKPIKTVTAGKSAVLCYFLLLGLAYMFLEMGFIQKMTLLIGHPVFGVAVTLLGFLVFSGCGSLASQFLFTSAETDLQSTIRRIRLSVLAVIVIGLIEIALFRVFFEWLVSFSQAGRFLIGLAITAPLAFFMGMPFPSALKHLGATGKPLVPWAWAVNGFASVIGAVLGTFMAISFGFTTLTLIALACYFLAAVVSNRMYT